MSNRSQFVEVNNEISATTQVTSGVPQGCVLAPVLFLLFINDLPTNIKTNIRLFADDCIIYREINSAEDHGALNKALSVVSDWCKDWQMALNVRKCAILTVTRKKHSSTFTYTINNILLCRVKQYKYLGLIITHDFRWDSHVKHVTSSAFGRLISIKRRLGSAPSQIKLLAYKTFVRSVLEYANVIWFPYTNQLQTKIERIQRKPIRFIFNKYKRTDPPSSAATV